MTSASITYGIRRYAADCLGKHPFESPADAQRVAARQRRKRRAVKVYRCAHCGCWHLGSSERGRA